MADYTYSPAPVLVETTGEFAIGATGVFRATSGGAAVAIYDLNNLPLTNVVVGPKGAHQAFKADIPNGVLDFGSVLLPTASLEQQQAALNAQAIAAQAAIDAAAAAAAALTASSAATTAESAAASAEASASAVPDAVQDINVAQIQPGVGIDRAVGAGNDSLTFSVKYGSTAGTAVQGNDARVEDSQPDNVAAIRRLARAPGAAAPGIHTHPVADLEALALFMRDFLGAATAADARVILDAASRIRGEALVFWEENGPGTKWGTTRPTGYKRVKFCDNGATATEDPALTIGLDVDVWEDL